MGAGTRRLEWYNPHDEKRKDSVVLNSGAGYPRPGEVSRNRRRSLHGAVEKSRQRCSRHFPVLTYWKYALRAKMTAALLDGPFGQTQGMLF